MFLMGDWWKSVQSWRGQGFFMRGLSLTGLAVILWDFWVGHALEPQCPWIEGDPNLIENRMWDYLWGISLSCLLVILRV